VAALMTGGAHAQTTTLIGPGTGAGDDIKNGGFESGTGAGDRTFANVDDWYNENAGYETKLLATTTSPRTGTYGGFVGARVSPGYEIPRIDTGYTIQAGDIFELTFYARVSGGTFNGSDKITAKLITASSTVIHEANVVPTATFGVYTATTTAIAAGSPLVGQTLHLLFFGIVDSWGDVATIDDITLKVTAGGPLPPSPVLISPGTGAGDDIKNGGFESIGGSDTYRPYSVISDWFNYNGNAAVNVVGSDRERTGTFGGSVAKPGYGAAADWSSPAVNTGHTIAAGETFSLTFYYGYCENWDVGTDKINVVLYSTSGVIWSDVVTPSQNALTGNFTQFTTNNIPAANIGEKLLLRFEPDADLGEYAAIDDVTLEVTATPRGTLVSFF
jgi:hypothetical protein